MKWKEYYWRPLGYFLTAGGSGLIIDELITGKFSLWPLLNHEIYGLILIIIGLISISRKPEGKDD